LSGFSRFWGFVAAPFWLTSFDCRDVFDATSLEVVFASTSEDAEAAAAAEDA
jgi:hypothetical protein